MGKTRKGGFFYKPLFYIDFGTVTQNTCLQFFLELSGIGFATKILIAISLQVAEVIHIFKNNLDKISIWIVVSLKLTLIHVSKLIDCKLKTTIS